MSKKKKSSSSFPIMLILIIAAVVGSNFAGPAKGWLTKAINSNKEVPSSEQGLQDETVTAAPPVVETQEIARVIPKKENIQKKGFVIRLVTLSISFLFFIKKRMSICTNH